MTASSPIAGWIVSAARDGAMNIGGAILFLFASGLLGALLRSGIETLVAWSWVWAALVFALAAGVAWSALFGLVRKEHLRNPAGKILPLPAIAFLGGAALVWVYIFAGLSYALMRLRTIEYLGDQKPEELLPFLTDAYMWHFLDILPGLKITDAVDWKSPVNLHGGGRGILLVLFRVAVIYQVFAKASQILKKDEPEGSISTVPGGTRS